MKLIAIVCALWSVFDTDARLAPPPEVVPPEVPFGQEIFRRNGWFTVPWGVTVVDVICIGGGGGGRDGNDPYSYGGNGESSNFGTYMYSVGGKGATSDNLGGGGGFGFAVFGGKGGVGGQCSAGGGAAGESSPGNGGVVAGSSDNPFCGGGGGGGCPDDNVPHATSGPGGKDPYGKSGGKYGGGAGSLNGGRAGGGAGYSRAVFEVSGGEKIQIIVGKGGSPSSGGKPADGIVVVAYGGNIDPTQIY